MSRFPAESNKPMYVSIDSRPGTVSIARISPAFARKRKKSTSSPNGSMAENRFTVRERQR